MTKAPIPGGALSAIVFPDDRKAFICIVTKSPQGYEHQFQITVANLGWRVRSLPTAFLQGEPQMLAAWWKFVRRANWRLAASCRIWSRQICGKDARFARPSRKH